jgi:hypothetical protein
VKIGLGKVAAIVCGLLAVAGCDAGGFSPGAELQIAYGAEYGGPGGTLVSFEDDPDTGAGPTAWHEIPGFVPEYQGHPAMSERLGYQLADCSDGQYRCVQIGLHAVFAIPRREFTIRQTFEGAGAELEVESCSDASCSLALITTRCAFWEMLDIDGMSYRCVREDSENAEEGRPMDFLYDRARGIVLIGEDTVCQPPFVTSDCSDGAAFVLKSKVGLLGPDS